MHLSNDSIQSTFLEEIRKRTPPHISLADGLAELLSISKDSAYRRMRGETILSLDEVQKICAHFRLSLDDLLSPSTTMVSFHQRAIDPVHFTFEMWLKSILNNLEMINTFPQKEIIYAAKDVPPFHYYQFPELASFKMFFWMKSYIRYPALANCKYDRDLVSENLLETGRKVWNNYASIPSTEIWSEETITVTLRQIEFYYESRIITRDQALTFCNEYLQLSEHLLQFVKVGSKIPSAGNFKFYKNDILIPETTIFFKMGDNRISYHMYNTLNVLTTSQESFCKQTEEYLTNVINNSEMLSTTGEKERIKFFNKMQDAIHDLKRKI